MYTTTNATREQALVAAAAAERVMERHVCCKSQFKFKCFSCGEFINRGDNITKCTAPCWDGMRLRFRGADARNGLTMDETSFYLAETGTRTWVHIGCNPCYWDSLPEDSNEYSPPALRPIHTDWGAKVYSEWEELTKKNELWELAGVRYYCRTKGYPKEKWMRDRIIQNVTRFQAIWRGYLYKKAYPLALAQRRREFLKWCGSLPADQFRSFPLFCQLRQTLNYGPLPETLNEKDEGEKKALTSYAHKEVKKGYQFEFIFDIGKSTETIYSGVVTNVGRLGGEEGVVSVRFHYDDEVRHYQNRRFFWLENQCKEFKKRKGIDGRIMEKLKTVRTRRYSQNSEQVNTEDWRYHYPDGNPVE